MQNQLLLYPNLFNLALDDQYMIQALTNIGLFGQPLNQPACFSAGEHFLELICFLGCSPMIDTDPKFLYLQWQQQAAVLHAGDNVRPPHCPHCRHRLESWQPVIQTWQQNPDYQWQCPNCQQKTFPAELDWRKRAALTKISLHIYGIYESEAIPSEQLLNHLQHLTNTTWQYSYIRQQ